MNLHSRSFAVRSAWRARLMLVFLVVLGLLAVTSAGFAVQIASITPTWADATGSSGAPSCLNISNSGASAEVRFGDNDANSDNACLPMSAQSGLGFTSSAGGTFTDGEPFLLGQLTHFNNKVVASSLLTSATLNLALSATNPVTPSISTVVTLTETANNLATCPYGDIQPCADQITVSPTVLEFPDAGVNYQIEVLGLIPGTAGSCAFSEDALTLSLISDENASNSACLFGRLTPVSGASLELSKSTTSTVLVPGEIVEYQINYSCASTTDSCRDVVLTDFLPPELVYVNSTGSIHTTTPAGIYSPASNTVRFDFINPLPAGSTGFVTIQARVLDNGTIANNQPITNTAVSNQTNGATTTTSTTTPAQTTSLWDVQKSGDPTAYISSEPPITDMTYTVQICPNGSDVNLLNAVMVDTLPPGATFVSATGAPTLLPGAPAPTTGLSWNLGDLSANGDCVARTVVVRFPNPPFSAGQTVTNNVTGTGVVVGGDPWTDTANLDRVLTQFIPSPSVNLNKATVRADGDYVVGAEVDFALTPQNTGNTFLYNLRMVDNLPPEIRTTQVRVGGSPQPIGLEYSTNSGASYSVWPGSPFNSNQTLNVSALGPNVWLTNLRWTFNPGGRTPPGWVLQPAAHIIGVITSPDLNNVIVTTDTVINNTASLYWEYLPGGTGDCSDPLAQCGTEVDNAIIDVVAIPRPGFDKVSAGGVSSQQRFIIGQDVGYYDLRVNNDTGIAIDNLTLTDVLPPAFQMTSVRTGSSGVTLSYRTPATAPGTWISWGTFGANTTANAPVNNVAEIRFQYGTVPAGFVVTPRIHGVTLAVDRNGVTVADGDRMINSARMDWTYQDVPSLREDATDDPVRLPTVTPTTSKTVTSSGPYIPTSAVSYRLSVGASTTSPSNVMNNPVAADLLPASSNFVSWSYNDNGTGLPAPTLEQLPNHDGTGRTLLRWRFTGSLQRGQTVFINVNTTLAAGTTAGDLPNTVYVTVNDMPINGGEPDTLDIDGDGDRTDSVVTDTTSIMVAPLVGLDSNKSVRGQLDSAFTRFPDYGGTVPNGYLDYLLTVVNRGNVPINNVRVVDILPFVGDTGVRDTRPRNSAWSPVLDSPVTPQAGVTVYYSTSGNPCRPQIVTTGPAGCTAPNWSLVPPAPITSVRSLRFDFDGTLAPGQSYSFQWRMRAPATGPVDGAIAWNSFAFTSTNALTGVPLFPAEPNKVGTRFVANDAPPLIDIEKATSTGANTPDDADFPTGPYIARTQPVTWTYVVTNTGGVPLNNIAVTDDVLGAVVCPQTTLATNTSMICTVTEAANPARPLGQYANIGSVSGRSAVDGTEVTDSDPSHYFSYDSTLARLGDYTWIDLDADGQQDSGEPPLGGITVRLLDDSGNPADDPNQPGTQPYVTTTDASGLYNFVNLPPGTYRVQFDVPLIYSLTQPNVGPDATDSDAVPVPGQPYGVTGSIVLAAGAFDDSVDAGFIGSGSLGDRIWLDSNGNGVQDTGETSTALVGGLKVELLGSTGTTVLHTTFTDLAGNYIFTDLPPGEYRVRFPAPPTGYLWTTKGTGTDNDSDVNPATNLTDVITLDAGENDPTWDAGLVAVASIGDFVWYDNNFDGVQNDGANSGAPGVTVRLLDGSGSQARSDDGSLIPDVVTGANGDYSFTNLRPGDYEVQFFLPSGTIFTTRRASASTAVSDSDAIETGANSGRTEVTTLSPAENDTRWDAGLIRLASIGDFVWSDNNNDGQQTSGEPAVSGVIVTLLSAATGNPAITVDALANPITPVTTTGTGLYSFTNLDPRIQYVVQFQRPEDYNFARPNTGSDATDSDAAPSGTLPLGIGRTGTITLAAGQNDQTIDAGLVPDSSLGNFVWYDTDNDGVQDTGELGVPNVTVRLLDTSFNQARDERGNLIPDQTTTAAGAYLFEHLRPGNYVVWFLPSTLPTGYAFARTGQGTASTNSDPNRFTGRTNTIPLGVNVDDMNWDAGVVTEAALGNLVWIDRDANGLQDGGLEVGVAGVTVRLLDGSNNAIDNPNNNTIGDAYTTTTDANGNYSFVGLPPNETYRVRWVLPSGYIWTRYITGTDGTLNSDGTSTNSTNTTNTTGNITGLTPGSTDNNWDQGVLLPSALGNYVWNDLNDDGLQNDGAASAVGRSGVAVTLLNRNGGTDIDLLTPGNQPRSTTTDASGAYSFANLYPGDYIVEFASQTTALRSPYNVGAGTNAGTDSDAQLTTGRTPIITLPYHTTDPNWDAGYVPLASIGNFVWRDNNDNGIQDTGEPGINNVTVRLLNSDGTPVVLDAFGNSIAARTTTTDASGAYSFPNLNPRLDYIVQFDPPTTGYKRSPYNVLTGGGTAANNSDANLTNGRTTVIPLNPGQTDNNWDAGFTPLASIGDRVWVDTNGNGIQDNGENGINGVTVTLRDGNGALVTTDALNQPIAPIQTAGGGSYVFGNLNAGDYRVEFTLPSGYIFTRPNAAGSTESNDSDADRLTGFTAAYTLGWGTNENRVDAGIVQPASLGDYLWYDGNDNGQQDDGPNPTVGAGVNGGMNGVRVELLDGNGNPVDTDLATAGVQNHIITADNAGNPGFYLFRDLIPGAYQVRFNLAGSAPLPLGGTNNANYVFARHNVGSDATDSDADRITGQTATINLTAGQNNLTNDAGILLRGAKLGNRVWIDLNNNGIQDSGEAGLDGVTVTLLNGSGGADIDPIAPGVQDARTTTSTHPTEGAGWYEFTQLVPGTYIVEVTLPARYQFSPPNAGSPNNDTVDSDVTLYNGGPTGRTTVITIGENADDPTWDAGLVPLASIGDRVWIDANDNGVQDNNEVGLGGVTVNLYRAGDTAPFRTTTTSSTPGSQGAYLFDLLPPGDYFLEFVRPAGYVRSPTGAGSATTDSDADVSTGRTVVTTLNPGENDLDWDAGFVPLASLGDYVWRDNNGNGIQDSGDAPLAGVTVTLLNATTGLPVATDGNGNPISVITTTGTGAYSFTNLDPRIDYIVEFSRPAGFVRSPVGQGTATTDSDANVSTGRTGTIALDPGQTDNSIDAGYAPLSTLGDRIWNDVNGNGIQDNGEAEIAGATVTLLDGSGAQVNADALGTAINPIVTTSSGAYNFINLPAGTYRIEVTPPATYVLTQPNAGGDDTADSDVDRFTGISGDYILDWGETDLTADAGVFQPARLGDFVWDDLNYNGQQDSIEPGISGVTVRLLDSSGNRVDDPNTDGVQDYIVTTGKDGYYQFSGLFPGDYIVEFVAPTGFQFTQANQGADATDSDANVTTGRTRTYNLFANESEQTVDAGLFRRASLGDRVWVDINNNGVQDSGENGYSGATVTLFTGAGVQVGSPAITDSSGSYSFTNLLPGDYYVVVTLPGGFQFSPTGQGTPSTDSDANFTTGRMLTTTLISGENDPTWDAGLVPLASMGNRVWQDNDGDGAQDNDEPGIGGVTVNLYRAGDTTPFRTTTTSSTPGSEGDYLFDLLPPGDYFLEFVRPGSLIFTRPDNAADDLDSDADRFTGRTVVTTLDPGEDDLTWDAGLLAPASLGDYVWEDVNDNGQQDEPASAGQNGITVRLLDRDGKPVDNPNIDGQQDYTVTTANDGSGNPGYYAFTGLFPGDYIVEFVLPSADWAFARPNLGAEASDSDADRATGRTPTVTITAGETNNDVDAGLLQLASLGDRVWVDMNNNGVQDSDESGYSGATVTLYTGAGVQVAVTTTASDGSYSFTDLVPGDYYVVVTLPGGYQFSPVGAGTPGTDSDADFATGRMPTTTLISGEDDMSWDAGLVPLASIGNVAWLDLNVNGVQDDTEVGIDGVTVNLYRAGETVPYRTMVTAGLVGTTGAAPFAALELPGNYLFELLPPGDYSLEFVLPPGRIFTPQHSPDATAYTDSDADTSTGRTLVTTLDPGENDMTWDAGVVPLGSIGDRVWLDVDGDGYQDDTDPGIPNVRITLTYPDGSTATTVTDANGNYLFEGLLAGEYTVTIDVSTLPLYLRVSYDPDGGAEHTATYTLGHGEDVRTLDFGYTPQNDGGPTPTPDLPEPTPAPTSTPVGPVLPGPGIDGATPTPVLPQPFCGTGCPSFRVYHTDETGDWEIFRLNSADALNRTTDRINLSLGIGEGVDDMAPSLSPNQEYIVFTSNRATAPNQPDNWEIYVAPTRGGDPNAVQRVTWNTTANDTDPVWGPNNWVVFESNRNGNWDLYAVDMATGIEYRLTDDPADDINAYWSPDGSRLIFQSQRDGQWQIYELTLGSLSVRRLSDGSAIDVDPLYSPDGLRIAFRTYTAADSDSVITLMDSAGRNRRAITSADENATNQVWSPSGALIAYQSDLDGDLDIYVHDMAANSTRKVTDNLIPDYAPAWRCTDDIVIFTSDVAGDPNIYEENARPISDPPVLVETDSDQLTFERFDDVYPQMNPSEENASREGQTPDGVFGEQTVFLSPQVGRIPPDLSVDGIIRDEWDTINGCASR